MCGYESLQQTVPNVVHLVRGKSIQRVCNEGGMLSRQLKTLTLLMIIGQIGIQPALGFIDAPFISTWAY
jgi:hypothetical protein